MQHGRVVVATDSDDKGVDTGDGCTERSVPDEKGGVKEGGERGDLVLSVASRAHPKARRYEIKVSPTEPLSVSICIYFTSPQARISAPRQWATCTLINPLSFQLRPLFVSGLLPVLPTALTSTLLSP